MQLAAAEVSGSRMGVRAAAEYLGVTPHYVYKRSASGEIRHYKIGGKLQFEPADLRAHLDSTRRGGK